MLKRWIALLLCLCLLTITASAEQALRTTFQVSFQMDADAYPEQDAKWLTPIADILNRTTLEGSLSTQEGRFQLQTDVLLNQAERTRTSLCVYGDKTRWMLQSSLLGQDTLSLSMLSLLEFAIKTYSHMDIPLQRVAVFASPYVHESALLPLQEAAAPYIADARAQGSLSYEDACALAAALAQTAEGSRAFTYWVKAFLMETGYDDALLHAMAVLEDWAAEIVPEDTGIVIESLRQPYVQERWYAGAHMLLEHQSMPNGVQRVHAELPHTPMGTIYAQASWQQIDGLLKLTVSLTVQDPGGNMLLRLHGEGELPTAFPVTQACRFSWSAEGDMIGSEHIQLLYALEPLEQGLILRQLDAESGHAMLTIAAQLHAEAAEALPVWEQEGIDVITISSDELSALVSRTAIPAAAGLLPILAEIPSATMQQLMDGIDESGILTMLAEGVGADDDEALDDEFWEEQEFSEDVVLDNSDAEYEIIW